MPAAISRRGSNSMAKTAALVGIATWKGNPLHRRYRGNLYAGIGGDGIRCHAVARAASHVVRRRVREQTYQPDDDIFNFICCWGITRWCDYRASPNQHARRAIEYTLCLPSSETEVSASSSAVRSTCRLPTILRRGSGKSSVPSPTPPGPSIQQGKKWLTAASSSHYATGRAWD